MDAGRKATDKLLAQMESKINSIYRQAAKEMEQKAADRLANFATQDEKWLKKLDAGEVTEKQYEDWRKRELLMNFHYANMYSELSERVLMADQIAAAYINGQLPNVYMINRNFFAAEFSKLDALSSWELIDENTVKALITSDKTLLPYMRVNGARVERWVTKQINSQVLQGIVQGESPYQIAARFKKVANMEKNAAVTNARTAVTSAENRGRLDMMREAWNMGLHVKKGWLSAHDGRTRKSHLAVDGEFVEIEEEFSNGLLYPGDPDGDPEEVYNCRCTMIYEVE